MRTVPSPRGPDSSKFEARLAAAEAGVVRRVVKAPWRLNESDARELAATMRDHARPLVFVARRKMEFSPFLRASGQARAEAKSLAHFIRSYPSFLADFDRAERMHRLEGATSDEHLESLATLLDELAISLAENASRGTAVPNVVLPVQAMRRGAGPGSPSPRTLCAASLAGLWLGWLRAKSKPKRKLDETISWTSVAQFTAVVCDMPDDPELADSLKRAVFRAEWPGVPKGNRP